LRNRRLEGYWCPRDRFDEYLEMRRFVVKAIALVSLFVLLGFMILLSIAVLGLWERDPFDKFEVIAIEGGAGTGRFALTYRYHHANSSSDVFATWVLPGSSPIGSTQPPAGRAEPVLVWTNGADVIARRWAEGQLVVTVPKGAERRPRNLDDCYFASEYGLKRPVCFDPLSVQLTDDASAP
jgi:hypothetical protein